MDTSLGIRRSPTRRKLLWVPQNKNGASVVVASGFDIGVSEEEDGEHDGDDVPSGEDEPATTEYIGQIDSDRDRKSS